MASTQLFLRVVFTAILKQNMCMQQKNNVYRLNISTDIEGVCSNASRSLSLSRGPLTLYSMRALVG